MKRTILSSVLAASLWFLVGCSSSYRVSSSPNSDASFNTFNAKAYDRSVVIVFHDGRECAARNIIASADSTRFLNETTDAMAVVPTHTIKKVIFTNHLVGLLEGLGWGAGIGAASAGLAALLGAFGEDVDAASVFSVIGAAAAGGAFGGGIIGVIIGHDYEFLFPTGLNSAGE
jgi:hypothetical protein